MFIKVTKMHLLGNDFVIIDTTIQEFKPLKSTIVQICHRNLGIGCDQLLIINQKNNNEFNYLIFNQDGSQAKYCGNGALCLMQYISLNYKINDSTIKLITNAFYTNGKFEKLKKEATIQIPKPSFNTQNTNDESNKYNIYTTYINNHTINYSVLSVGNLHAVIELNQSKFENLNYLKEVALHIQSLPCFTDSVNVNFYYTIDNQNIKIITYERGAGLTNACGSGACATSYYAFMKNNLDANINVHTIYGYLKVLHNTTSSTITGYPTHVFDAQLLL